MENGSGEVHPVHCLQIALYVMCGGGGLGVRAAEHPATFRIPPGAPRLPYSHERIYDACALLTTIAHEHGLNPDALPRMPSCTGMTAYMPARTARLHVVR